ncbi:MAG: hypothetical protein WKF76_06180 [Nocardioidaceae bacterium]
MPTPARGIVDDLWEHGGLPSVYFLVDGRLRCQAARGYFQVVDGFPPGTGVIGQVVATGESAIINDLSETPHFIAAIPGLNAEACAAVSGARPRRRRRQRGVGQRAARANITDLLACRRGPAGCRRSRQQVGMPPVPLAQRLARIVVSLTSLTEIAQIRARAVEGAIELSEYDELLA